MKGQLALWEEVKPRPVAPPASISYEAIRDMERRVQEAGRRLPEDTSPERAVYFTENELRGLRRLLLPNRMSHHDSPGEAKLRRAIAQVDGSRTSD